MLSGFLTLFGKCQCLYSRVILYPVVSAVGPPFRLMFPCLCWCSVITLPLLSVSVVDGGDWKKSLVRETIAPRPFVTIPFVCAIIWLERGWFGGFWAMATWDATASDESDSINIFTETISSLAQRCACSWAWNNSSLKNNFWHVWRNI